MRHGSPLVLFRVTPNGYISSLSTKSATETGEEREWSGSVTSLARRKTTRDSPSAFGMATGALRPRRGVNWRGRSDGNQQQRRVICQLSAGMFADVSQNMRILF